MLALTVRIPDAIAKEVEQRAKKLHITRSEYIRQSIENMNQALDREEKRARLIKSSNLVRNNSMSVNAEFAEVEHDPKS